MEIANLLLQNPWWRERSIIKEDKKVKTALGRGPKADFDSMKLNRVVIRGPRQVGKTTWIKLFIHDLLLEKKVAPEAIFYFSCESIRDKKELIDLAELYFEFANQHNIKERYVFLDEVTFVNEWELAIKHLIEVGRFEDAKLVLTGSSARDLKKGTERMPGRGIKDYFFWPLSFREYALLFSANPFHKILENTRLILSDIKNPAAIKRAAFQLIPYLNELNSLLTDYIKTGGFLNAIYELKDTKTISEDTYQIYIKWIQGDLNKLNKSETIFLQVIKGIIEKYTSNFGLSSLANDLEISAHSVLKDYLEVIEQNMLIEQLYQMDLSKKAPRFKKERKVYFIDPFLFNCFKGYSTGAYKDYSTDAESSLIESTVVSHISRLYKKADQLLAYNHVGFYLDRKGEVDLLAKVDNKLVPIEVKWKNAIKPSDFKHAKTFKQMIFLSKKEIEEREGILVVPVSLFLSALDVKHFC